MANQEIFRDSDITTDTAGGVFYFGLERGELWHRKAELDIVVHLYFCDTRTCCMPVPAFTDIRVERALCDEIRPKVFYLFFQHILVHTTHCEAFITHRRLSLRASKNSSVASAISSSIQSSFPKYFFTYASSSGRSMPRMYTPLSFAPDSFNR